MLGGIKLDVTKVIIIVVILAVVIGIGYGVYKWGKSKQEPSIKDIPKEVTGNLTEVEIEELGALAKNLKNDMDDFGFTNNETLYYEASTLTDRKLIGLNNIFNSMYELSSGETLLEWIQSESFTSMFTDIDSYADTIEKRLIELSLT